MGVDPDQPEPGSQGSPAPGAPDGPSDLLGRALLGQLPCITCGYELQGLSVSGRCPECGTFVRATILYTVDPQAEEFRPVTAPRLVSSALLLWAFGGLAATLSLWIPRVADMIGVFTVNTPGVPWAKPIIAIALGASMLGMAGLVRPIRDSPLRESLLVGVATLCYVPLIWSVWRVLSVVDPASLPPYLESAPMGHRIALRLIAGASAMAILLAFRPTARRLVRRSVALRTGRVDRQTILAMVAALLVSALGDAIRLWSLRTGAGDILLNYIGTVIVFVGSGFFTLGMVGATIDSWRIARVLRTPAPSMRQLLGGPAEAPGSPPA